MKKIIALVLALMMCLSLCACGGKDTPETDVPETNNQSTNEPEADVSVTDIIEGDVSEDDVPEDTELVADTAWVLDYLVDDFGDDTDSTYIKCVAVGDFSNTATTSSELLVTVFFIPGVANESNESGFWFRLFEYGDKPATYTSNDEIIMKIKVGDEIITEKLYGTAPNGDLLLLEGDMLNKLTHTLPTEDQEIRCIIEIGSSKYNFTMPLAGYADSFNAMMQSYGFEGYDVVEELNGKLFTRTID